MNVPHAEIQTFIVIHDADLAIECEREGRFTHLPHYTYLFVGARDIAPLADLDNVILVRDLPHNIEQFPHLLSFTGWYAVARNNLARAPWVSLLEYDVALAEDFADHTLRRLKAARRIVGYVPFPLSHPMYMHATPYLIPAFRDTYGIDLAALVRDHLAAGHPDQWTATTNASMSVADLQTFVDWFLPMTPYFRRDPIGAHVHERALPIFCILQRLENHLATGVLKHIQSRSHGIHALSWKAARAEAEKQRPGK